MSKVFNFKERKGLELELSGNKFSIDIFDPVIVDNLESFGKQLINISESYGDVKDSSSMHDTLKDVMESCVEGFDSLLGEGATAKIFEGRKMNFIDVAELSEFVVSELSESIKLVNSEILERYSPQRPNK